MFKPQQRKHWAMGLSLALASFSLALSPVVQAGPDHKRHHKHTPPVIEGPVSSNQYYDYAWVISSKPIYKEVQVNHPQQVCWNETRYHQVPQYTQTYSDSSATAPILGAIIGGAIGNKLGHKKSNKRIGTVAGALLGGAIAIDHSKGQRVHQSYSTQAYTQRQCRTDNQISYENRIVAYKVKYRYKGKVYKTRMNQQPGDQIRVAINVSPVGY